MKWVNYIQWHIDDESTEDKALISRRFRCNALSLSHPHFDTTNLRLTIRISFNALLRTFFPHLIPSDKYDILKDECGLQ